MLLSFCALNEFAASLNFGSIVKSASCVSSGHESGDRLTVKKPLIYSKSSFLRRREHS